MLSSLSNTNGGVSNNAVTNKKISDLENAVSEINTCLDELNTDVEGNTSDIQSIKECVANGTFECNVSGDIVEARTKVTTDIIAGNTSDTITIEDDICGQNATFNSVTATEVSDTNNNTLASVVEVSCNAKATAEGAVNAVTTLAAVVDADKADLEDYKHAVSECVVTSCVDSTNIRAGSVVSNSNCTTCLVANDAAISKLSSVANTFGGILEPTSKDEEEYYEIILPDNFSGKASFVGVDSNDKVLFSATIDNAIANTDLQDREGTALVIHSSITKYDFYQVLRKRDTDVISFITKSNVAKIFWQYSNYDKTEEPTYVIYPNLTDRGPDYNLYSTIYTAEHSDQVVVLGSEDTLNGGLTVFGTFKATAFEIPESEVTNVFVKNQIHGGYECDTGEYTTCGTPGGVITFNQRDLSGECNVSWINGEPRQVVRKGTCYGTDSATGEDLSYLQFETVKTCDDTTGTFQPSMTDSLFDERGLATYEGVTSNNCYPIKHLNADTCVHGTIDIECKAVVDELQSHDKEIAITSDINVTGTAKVNALDVTCDAIVHGDLTVEGTLTSIEERQVVATGDYLITRQGNTDPLGANEYSGVAINNYQSNCFATITADCSGEWRVSNSSSATVTSYTNIHNYNNTWYSGFTQATTITVVKGIEQNPTIASLDNVVYYNDIYYYSNSVNWYPLTVDSVAHKLVLGNVVTDESTITALEALSKKTLTYYFTLDVAQIDNTTNQPLLTRSERTSLCNNDILVWNSNDGKAVNMSRPTCNCQVPVATVDATTGAVTYAWTNAPSAVVYAYDYTCDYETAAAIPYGCPGWIPPNAIVVIRCEDNLLMGVVCQ